MKGCLHHIELYVKDLKVSSDFYSWLLSRLGYQVYQQWEQGISYKLGDCYLVLVQVESRFLDIPYHRCRAGLNHLAFHSENRAFIDEITTELKARGVTILYPERHPQAGGKSSYSVFFEDPDRIKLEITM